jgi:tRNA(Ile)-lysidine synthase
MNQVTAAAAASSSKTRANSTGARANSASNRSTAATAAAAVKSTAFYPKPGPTGGRLIRQVISAFRVAKVPLPIDSHILIAVSGGSDSLALAHLLLKYGRRVVSPEQVTLLHVNHSWRGKASDQDAEFVKRFGRKWKVPVLLHKLRPPTQARMKGESWEDVARQARKAIYQTEATRLGAKVLTAHQADDLAETVLWRLLTGAAETHGGGITFAHGVEMRPILSVRKAELRAYLEEERQVWREDETNAAGRFLRSRMRSELMPAIEKLFPRAVEHLVRLGHQAAMSQRAQASADESTLGEWQALSSLIGASNIPMRRANWDALRKALIQGKSKATLALPGGWRLSREPTQSGERWVLESSVSSR